MVQSPDNRGAEALARIAWRAALRREPGPAELRSAVERMQQGTITPEDLLRELVATAEWAQAELSSSWSWGRDPRVARFRTPAAEQLSRRLERERPIDPARFDELWRLRFDHELGPGEPEDALRQYGLDHRRRFEETARAMSILLEDRPAPRVLDFGISVFMWFYRRLFPQIELVTSDRPVPPPQQAFFERGSRDAGAVAHVTVDLADPGFMTEAAREAFGTFDLILLTEVLEHLPAHPLRVLRPLVGLLRPGGRIYLTTPNCFSRTHLARVARRINPQAVFPFDGNGDGAHHYREFAMPELLEFVDQAGGVPEAFYFSGCWDAEPDLEPSDQRSNLVVAVGRPRG